MARERKWLVYVSVYGIKTIHFLSISVESLEWTNEKRVFYCNVQKKMTILEFLRLNINYDYNLSMGYFGVEYYLKKQYRFDYWLPKFK